MKIISEILSNMKAIPINGLFLFVGIDSFDTEIIKVIEPPVRNKFNYYRCDNKFHTWIIEEFYKIRLCEKNQILILMNGDETFIYSVEKTIQLIDKTNGLLVKRHRKGGQSSIRFSRLAEESRHHYTERVMDLLKKNNIDINSTIIVSGSRELGNDMEKLLIKRSWKHVLYVEKWLNFTTITIRQNETEILEFFDSLHRESKEKEIKLFIDEIAEMSDLVVYLQDLKDELQVEKIICNEDVKKEDWWPEDKIFIVRINSPLYSRLKQFGGVIGKLYKNN